MIDLTVYVVTKFIQIINKLFFKNTNGISNVAPRPLQMIVFQTFPRKIIIKLNLNIK